ncbi:MAG: methionyl-tRNA formyltransferase [Urechidicola sp.]|jgi:methionyl-tRNA formyltransferase
MNILFAGTPEFAAAHLQALLTSEHTVVGVITQPDKPGKRGKQPVASAVKQLALRHHLPVLQPARLRLPDLQQYVVDVMVVVAYGQILKSDVLAYPRLGCINVHGSVLPQWRGAAPVQRAILAGDETSGVCIMEMDVGLDTGAVLQCVQIPIAPRETSASLSEKLSHVGQKALLDVLAELAVGQALATAQVGEPSYACKLEKHEALIEWNLPALEIDRQIRGFNPDPVAFTHLQDLRLKVWSAVPADPAVDKNIPSNQPGEILAVEKHGVLVACGIGTLWLQSIQVPLGKGSILSAADILNSRKDLFAEGTILR